MMSRSLSGRVAKCVTRATATAPQTIALLARLPMTQPPSPRRNCTAARISSVSCDCPRCLSLPLLIADALDKRRDLVDFAFRTYMSIIEQRLSFADFTPAGNKVMFDLDNFLRGNPYERAQVYEILNRIGAMSIDEIRAEEDMLL